MNDLAWLKQKIELIIKGMEIVADDEDIKEFTSLLDTFTNRMLSKAKRLQAQEQAQRN